MLHYYLNNFEKRSQLSLALFYGIVGISTVCAVIAPSLFRASHYWHPDFLIGCLLYTAVILVSVYLAGMIEIEERPRTARTLVRMMMAWMLSIAGLSILSLLTPFRVPAVKTFVVVTIVMISGGGLKILIERRHRRRASLNPGRRFAWIGSQDSLEEFLDILDEGKPSSHVCAGFIGPESPTKAARPAIPCVAPNMKTEYSQAIKAFLEREHLDLLIHGDNIPLEDTVALTVLRNVSLELRILDALSYFEELTGRTPNALGSSGVFFRLLIEGKVRRPLFFRTKRLIDVFLSATGLLLASPLMLGMAVLIRTTSPGPALFRQRRVGYLGNEFELYKFRTMDQDAERGGPQWAKANDPRTTPLGRLFRALHLDELPQLFNVLVGTMSLIGPRPIRMVFLEQLAEKHPSYFLRQVVKPGITGWAQVRDLSPRSGEGWGRKIEYDLFYVRNQSLLLDFLILIKTVQKLLIRHAKE